MGLLIVSGLSGAGKSLVVNALEDIGYFCIDNLPPALLDKFVEFSKHTVEIEEKLAVVMDIRGGEDYNGIQSALDLLDEKKVLYKCLFLDADNEVLARRYKETRRTHPISQKNHLEIDEAIRLEREILSPFYSSADYIIDTSILSTAQLRDRVVSLFVQGKNKGMAINILSFGFKFGAPKEADLLFDVRCLPNPFYIEELKHKTGLDEEVSSYVMKFDDSKNMLNVLKQYFETTMPLYLKEGKSQLTIAIGCTGGKHRSVTLALLIYKYLDELGYSTDLSHRDIKRGISQ